jgi:hypothetical protein
LCNIPAIFLLLPLKLTRSASAAPSMSCLA